VWSLQHQQHCFRRSDATFIRERPLRPALQLALAARSIAAGTLTLMMHSSFSGGSLQQLRLPSGSSHYEDTLRYVDQTDDLQCSMCGEVADGVNRVLAPSCSCGYKVSSRFGVHKYMLKMSRISSRRSKLGAHLQQLLSRQCSSQCFGLHNTCILAADRLIW
jgi:hypothetical protein